MKCGAGDGYRRSFGPIMLEMKNCYGKSREEEYTNSKRKEG